jgi:hypothetical protein
MAGSSIQATALPRFLLPQLSWSSRAVRPVALGALEARRHISAPASRCAPGSVTTAIQQQLPRPWRTSPSQSALGSSSPLDGRRHFSATAPQLKDHHFDTLKFVQRLKEEGFTEQQAEGMMRILGDVIEERYGHLRFYPKLLGLTCPVYKTSLEPWSSEKTRRKRHTRRKSILQSCAPNS